MQAASIPKPHQSSILSNNILNQTIYNPVSELPLSTKLWWQSFGMFFLILLITQVKEVYGFDLWISSILTIVIMLSVKQSGAHYNTTMTLSNFLIKFSPTKINPNFIWQYFKADFLPALLAWTLGYYMRSYHYPPPTPTPTLNPHQILLSEFIGSFMLVLMLQKIANTQTTFTTSDIETYSFVVVFVYVARKFAVMSGNSINPVATLAYVCTLGFRCQWEGLKGIYLYLVGDFFGGVFGCFVYNLLLEPAIQISRKQKQQQHQHQSNQTQSNEYTQLLPTITITPSPTLAPTPTPHKTPPRILLIQQHQTIQINKLTNIQHRSDVFSDHEGEMRLLEEVRQYEEKGEKGERERERESRDWGN